MDTLWIAIATVMDQFIEVLKYPLNPGRRIFWAYLLTSLLIAYFVYRTIKSKGDAASDKDRRDAEGSFVQFLFPKSVWSHPSAWLDVRYFFFHRVSSYFLLLGVGASGLALGFHLGSGGVPMEEVAIRTEKTTANDWMVAVLFMFIGLAVVDFTAWFIHYLQHKVPVLWQFHKVHHSAEVMHPISNFREHPVDNLAYGFFTSFSLAVCFGIANQFVGYVPTMPTLLGLPLLMFLFNVVGYNLRHSHVWLRWPGRWSQVFPSPAHHHVHHSCHPDHIDKNFAFIFPVWDVIFGTYLMPEDNRDVKFGVPEEEGRDLDGVFRLYWVPFRDVFRMFVPKAASEPGEQAEEGAPKQVPAE